MRSTSIILLLFCVACSRGEDTGAPNVSVAVERETVASQEPPPPSPVVPRDAKKLDDGSFMKTVRTGTGPLVATDEQRAIVYGVTFYSEGSTGTAIQAYGWKEMSPTTRAILQGARMGEMRRVWVCDKSPCKVFEYTMLNVQGG